MQIENLGDGTSPDAILLRLAVSLLEEGLFVGGKRSAGLGKIRLRKDSLKVRGFKDSKEMWTALQAGKDPNRELSLKELLHA
jgi:CRISPR/Cas system CSM-associated protein Csm3 (group 7 of RAMP superfamily)